LPYTTFSEHVRRDFADSLTAAIFHDEGDALLATVDSQIELFQTVAAIDPGPYNFRRQIRLDGRLYALGDIVSMAISASVRLKAELQSTGMTTDGQVALSPSEYASGHALRVGDLTATFMLTEDSARPALISLCFTGNGTFTAGFTRCGSIHAMGVLGVQEGAPVAWNAVSTVSSMKVDVAVVREDAQLVSKDAYKIVVSWYGDQYGTMKRRRGDVEGHYGAYTSVSLDFRSSTVRSLYNFPPGAASAPLIAAIVKDLCHASKTGITVYDAFTGRNALVHIYPAAGIFDTPMAGKLSNTIGATCAEHCTSCDSVGLKTTSERKERAMRSTMVFDVRDARYARVQERTVAVQRTVIGAGLSSEATIKAALLLNGMQKGPGDQFMGLSEARGAGSFDVHHHVIVAPSHLLFFNLAGPLLQQVHNALSVLQRDEYVNDMRACPRYLPRHTVLKAFEPEKMGGTTLSMPDHAVLFTITPTVMDDMHSETVLPALAASGLAALKAIRAFVNALFFRPTNRNDEEHAVGCKPTVHTLQLSGFSLLNELASLTIKGSTGKSQACTESSSFSIGPCHLFKLGRPYASCCLKSSVKFQERSSAKQLP